MRLSDNTHNLNVTSLSVFFTNNKSSSQCALLTSPATMCLCVGLSPLFPLLPLSFLLRLGSAPEIQEISLLLSLFSPIGCCHVLIIVFIYQQVQGTLMSQCKRHSRRLWSLCRARFTTCATRCHLSVHSLVQPHKGSGRGSRFSFSGASRDDVPCSRSANTAGHEDASRYGCLPSSASHGVAQNNGSRHGYVLWIKCQTSRLLPSMLSTLMTIVMSIWIPCWMLLPFLCRSEWIKVEPCCWQVLQCRSR